jgi:hypothetical protein
MSKSTTEGGALTAAAIAAAAVAVVDAEHRGGRVHPTVPVTGAPTPNTAAPTPNTAAPTPNTAAPTPNTAAPTPNTGAPNAAPAEEPTEAIFHDTTEGHTDTVEVDPKECHEEFFDAVEEMTKEDVIAITEGCPSQRVSSAFTRVIEWVGQGVPNASQIAPAAAAAEYAIECMVAPFIKSYQNISGDSLSQEEARIALLNAYKHNGVCLNDQTADSSNLAYVAATAVVFLFCAWQCRFKRAEDEIDDALQGRLVSATTRTDADSDVEAQLAPELQMREAFVLPEEVMHAGAVRVVDAVVQRMTTLDISRPITPILEQDEHATGDNEEDFPEPEKPSIKTIERAREEPNQTNDDSSLSEPEIELEAGFPEGGMTAEYLTQNGERPITPQFQPQIAQMAFNQVMIPGTEEADDIDGYMGVGGSETNTADDLNGIGEEYHENPLYATSTTSQSDDYVPTTASPGPFKRLASHFFGRTDSADITPLNQAPTARESSSAVSNHNENKAVRRPPPAYYQTPEFDDQLGSSKPAPDAESGLSATASKRLSNNTPNKETSM